MQIRNNYAEEMTFPEYPFDDWYAETSFHFHASLIANMPRFHDFHRDYLAGMTPYESFWNYVYND